MGLVSSTPEAAAAAPQNNDTLVSPRPGDPKGTDATFKVDDLLRFTERQVVFDEDAPPVVREELEGVDGAFLLHNVLTPAECQQYIDISLSMGYEPSPLTVLGGDYKTSQRNERTKQIRDSWRVLWDAHALDCDVVNKRVVDHLPQQVTVFGGEEWNLKREAPVNERWRFNKYDIGQKFGPHFDAGFMRNINEQTLLTFIVYLNEGFEGGETVFFPGGITGTNPPRREEVRVVPKTGMALVFFQAGQLNHRHEGAPHTSEDVQKFILRSDIAYQRAKPM